MSNRAALYVAGLALAAASCGGAEEQVVDNYFNAVRAQDNQTLSSFAAVDYTDPVDSWKVTGSRDEAPAPTTLRELAARVREAEAELAANKKAASAYSLQRWADIQKVNEIKAKGRAMPASLGEVAGEWDKFNQKDKDLKRQHSAAKGELEREKKSVLLSVGEQEGLEDMEGQVETKLVDVEVTSKGQTRAYLMTLRRYNLKREQGPRVMSRWIVQDLKPRP